MKTIVVGFDGSPAAQRALERAAELSGSAGRVVVVAASVLIPSRSVVEEPIVSPSPEQRDALLDQAADALRSHDIEPTLVAADAEPTEALVQAVRSENADLLIIGGTGSGYVTRALIGSTAETIVRQAPCDVLVVR
jgi:nucleotide-binding universal stress UspA family protein